MVWSLERWTHTPPILLKYNASKSSKRTDQLMMRFDVFAGDCTRVGFGVVPSANGVRQGRGQTRAGHASPGTRRAAWRGVAGRSGAGRGKEGFSKTWLRDSALMLSPEETDPRPVWSVWAGHCSVSGGYSRGGLGFGVWGAANAVSSASPLACQSLGVHS